MVRATRGSNTPRDRQFVCMFAGFLAGLRVSLG